MYPDVAPACDELLSVDAADLTEFTGGNHRPGHTSSSNAPLTAALTSITDSLKSLSGKVVFPTFCHDETIISGVTSRLLALTRFPGKHRYSARELLETARVCGLRVVTTETIPGVIPICYADAVFF